MAKTLFVGSIAWATTSESLKAAFSEGGFSVTAAKVITDRETGRSKGFGFVDVANDDDAAKLIDKWNGADLEGRKIVVNEARPREARA